MFIFEFSDISDIRILVETDSKVYNLQELSLTFNKIQWAIIHKFICICITKLVRRIRFTRGTLLEKNRPRSHLYLGKIIRA